MKVIDEKETARWLSGKGFINPEGKQLLPGFLAPLSYRIPTDSGKKTALSNKIASYFDADDEVLLWINEWGIWPSSENLNLFYGFRRSFGEYGTLKEKPGHIFSRGDIVTLESLLCLVFYFVWGAVLVSTAKNFIIRISHDENMDLYLKEKTDVSDIQESLNSFLRT